MCGAGFGDGIVFDGIYGEVTAKNVLKWQERMGIETDGNFGPKSRKIAKERYNFDFEGACLAIVGKSVFLQPNGETKDLHHLIIDVSDEYFDGYVAEVNK